jgi:hypothetical protein
LPVALHGFETTLTLREDYKLRVIENRVLRGIFGPKMERVTGGLRRQHNKEMRDLYNSSRIIIIIKLRRMRWAEHVARIGRRGTRRGFR